MCASSRENGNAVCYCNEHLQCTSAIVMYVSLALPDPIIAGALSLTVASQQYKHLTHAMGKSQSIYYLKLHGEVL